MVRVRRQCARLPVFARLDFNADKLKTIPFGTLSSNLDEELEIAGF
jgi:hypothetical protein